MWKCHKSWTSFPYLIIIRRYNARLERNCLLALRTFRRTSTVLTIITRVKQKALCPRCLKVIRKRSVAVTIGARILFEVRPVCRPTVGRQGDTAISRFPENSGCKRFVDIRIRVVESVVSQLRRPLCNRCVHVLRFDVYVVVYDFTMFQNWSRRTRQGHRWSIWRNFLYVCWSGWSVWCSGWSFWGSRWSVWSSCWSIWPSYWSVWHCHLSIWCNCRSVWRCHLSIHHSCRSLRCDKTSLWCVRSARPFWRTSERLLGATPVLCTITHDSRFHQGRITVRNRHIRHIETLHPVTRVHGLWVVCQLLPRRPCRCARFALCKVRRPLQCRATQKTFELRLSLLELCQETLILLSEHLQTNLFSHHPHLVHTVSIWNQQHAAQVRFTCTQHMQRKIYNHHNKVIR